MRIINATWEKRNLGCDAIEITLDSSDALKSYSALKDDIEATIASYNAGYAVLKFNSSENTLLHLPSYLGKR